MGMFDYYEPVPALSCPVCGAALREWQGTDGSSLLFVWRQGQAAPVDQRVDPECRMAEAQRRTQKLPPEFILYSTDCDCPYPVEAVGTAPEGVWTATVVMSAATADRYRSFYSHWRKSDYRAWRRWLQQRRPGAIAGARDERPAAEFAG